jgi:hypothetical protein
MAPTPYIAIARMPYAWRMVDERTIVPARLVREATAADALRVAERIGELIADERTPEEARVELEARLAELARRFPELLGRP